MAQRDWPNRCIDVLSKKGTTMFRRWVYVLSVMVYLTVHSPAAAGSTWDGGGSDNNWSSALNWSDDITPANDGTADMTLTGTTRLTPNVDVPWSINSLTFSSNAGAFTLGGGPLTIEAGGVIRQGSSTNRQSLADQIALGADQTWNTGNGYINLGSSGSLDTNGHTLSVTGNGMQFLGAVKGTGSIVVSTSNYVCLWGTNTFSGGVVINSGTLDISSDSGFGAAGSPVTINGGLLEVQEHSVTVNHDITIGPNGGTIYTTGETVSISGNIHGSGGLTVWGGSVLNLTGTNSYAGGTYLYQAQITGTTNSLQGNISGGDLVKFQQDFNGIYSGNMSGGMVFAKYGIGTVTLTGRNTYGSDTEIHGGVLEIAGPNALSPSTRVNFWTGGFGVLQFVGPTTFTRALKTGVLWNGAGGFAARNGKLTVNLGGNQTQFTLDPVMPLVFGSPTANSITEFQNPVFLGNGQTTPAPTIQVNAGTGGDYAILSGQISGANWLLKTGNGTLQLTAANTFTGALILGAGATQCNDGTGLPTACPLQIAGGVLLSDGNATFSRSLGTGSGQVCWTSSGGFAAAGSMLTVNLSGNGATQTWGGANFVPNGSALIFGATRATEQTVFVNPLNLGTATREIHVDAGLGGDFATLFGSITGPGGLTKTGGGLLELAAANTYQGPTIIGAGTLKITNTTGSATGSGPVTVNPGAALSGSGSIGGPLTVAGTVTPGSSPGILTVNNQVTFQTGSTFSAEVYGLIAGIGYDELTTTGPVSLTGSLAITFGTFTPSSHDILFLINNTGSGATNGTFQFADNSKIGTFNGCDWYITYDANNATSPSLNGGNDVAIYSVVVPEPTTLLLLATGLLGLLSFAWRKRR
jgi:autotransporter-associated beta strand protein